MGTIIAHGKSQWGRANKNIRTDAELEAEKAYIAENLPKSVSTDEAKILKDITENIEAGTKIVTRIVSGINTVDEKLSTSSIFLPNENRNPTVLSHQNNSEKKYKDDDVISKNEIVDSPSDETIQELPKPSTKKNRTKRKNTNRKRKLQITDSTEKNTFAGDVSKHHEVETDII